MWTRDLTAQPACWTWSAPARARLVFSTRRGGVSAPPFDTLNLGRSVDDDPQCVATNRRRLLEAAGLSAEQLATAGQVHGARIVEVTQPGHTPACDALLTRTPGLALAVTTADCMALLFEAPGAVAAAHSGWRGTEAGMIEATLAALLDRARCAIGDIRVHLGPCIRGCCYAVGEDVAERFPTAAIRREANGTYLDLPTAARLRLFAAGVKESAFHDTNACTACEPSWYFSHRRDAGLTGRHWGVIARNAEP